MHRSHLQFRCHESKSPIESFACISGERFRFHLQTPEIRNRKFSLSYSTEINIKGRSWSPSSCPFGEMGKTWEATKYKWPTFEKNHVRRKQARSGPATFRPGPFLELNFTARPERAARPVQTSGVQGMPADVRTTIELNTKSILSSVRIPQSISF